LGVQPIEGRIFTAADDRQGCGLPGDVISYRFWQRELGGDEPAIGRKLTLNGNPVEIIGVTPAEFSEPPNRIAIHRGGGGYRTLSDTGDAVACRGFVVAAGVLYSGYV
jgi:hypothetical protein